MTNTQKTQVRFTAEFTDAGSFEKKKPDFCLGWVFSKRKARANSRYHAVARSKRSTTVSGRVNDVDDFVNKTLKLLEDGPRMIDFHPKKEYVLIVGKAGTGENLEISKLELRMLL